jgi:predicted GH43/DUF377 family glycosyl hydrolase
MVFTGRSEPANGEIYLGHAVSKDGIHFDTDPEPLLRPDPNPDSFDHANVEDARVTEMDGKYYIAYAGRSLNLNDFGAGKRRVGPDGNRNPTWTENYRRGGFAVTTDWKTVERLGPCTSEHIHDANIVLFPEKINGKYAILHRPTAYVPWTLPAFYHPSSIWLAYVDELGPICSNAREMPWNMKEGVDIPDDHMLITGVFEWENFVKVGASGVPIPTDDGWLMFYHAVDRMGVYRVGLLLLDRENPLKVIGRSPLPLMEPETEYENLGVENFERLQCFPYCVFPCANLVVGDEIWLYYGAADIYTCLATLKFKDAMEYITSPVCREAAKLPPYRY